MSQNAGSPAVQVGSRPSARILALLSVLPFLGLALWNLRAPLDLSIGDQAHYVLHADALLEGRRYTDNGYIYYPPHALNPEAYPPGLPLVIAAVRGAGGSIVAVRVVLIAAAVAFLLLACRYLAARDDPWLAAGAVFLTGFVPQLALFASGLYTDFIFAALIWGCFLLVDRPVPWTAGRIAALALVGAIAISFRTAGVALIPALALFLAWRAVRHREPWMWGFIPLALWVAAYVAINHWFPVTSGYAGQIAGGITGRGIDRDGFAVVRLAVTRVLAYREMVTELHLTPVPWRPASLAYHVLALAMLAIGAVSWMRRAGVRFLFCFVAAYVGMLLLLPWALNRLVWPLIPVLWFATLEGTRAVFVRLAGRERALRIAVGTAAVIGVTTGFFGASPTRPKGVSDYPEGRELYAVLERVAAREPVRALYFNPRDAARVEGVSAMVVPELPPDSLLAQIRAYRISHAVLGSIGVAPNFDRRVRAAVAEYPHLFEAMFTNQYFTLYRIVPQDSAGASPSPR